MTRRLLVLLATAACCAAAAAPARAEFGISAFSAGLTTLQAGAHPDVSVDLRFPTTTDDAPEGQEGPPITDGNVRRIDAALPPGLIVDPAAVPTCTQEQLATEFVAQCPVDSQVGVLELEQANTGDFVQEFPIYNVVPAPGVPAQLGVNVYKVVVQLDGVVRTGGDYGISARVRNVSQAIPIKRARVTLWGDPADATHDGQRYRAISGQDYAPRPLSSGLPPTAFTANPTSCGGPLTFAASAASWQEPTRTVSASTSTRPDGTPLTVTGCDGLPFEPTLRVQPTTTAPDAPTGLDVTLDIPQSRDPAARASAHLRALDVTLPEGMTVNPAAAAGLAACTPAQAALATPDAPTCPDASSLGSVQIDTPLLREPLRGHVYLAAQRDNPFGTDLALYLVATGQGVVVKLPGRVDTDAATGRVRVRFADDPQLPFSQLQVRFDDGPRAALATPATCGPQTVSATATPWSGGTPVALTDGFTVDCPAGLGAFAPVFRAGSLSPVAGRFSSFALAIGRPDGQQTLRDLSLTLPPGLLAKLAGVPLCADGPAASGACDAASRVGSATVTAGAGSQPFPLTGDVYLTGPYRGAPYGLAVRVRAVAGPLDLGTVVVRQALSIDPVDTHVTVVSDPLPTILAGIPIRLRDLDVVLDRPEFTVNPTRCVPSRVTGALGSAAGATASVASPFAVGDCASLPLRPKLSLSLAGRPASLRRGRHPAVRARLTQGGGQSGLRRVEVKLPLSLALAPENAQTLCEAEAGAATSPACPAGSVVGHASVRSPLLPNPLTGPVYLVKGVRRTASGRTVRTLPKLVLPLRGNGLLIDVRANTTVRGDHLVTQFDGIPDAPVSRFDLTLDGGRHGILVNVRDVCRAARGVPARFRGHTGRLATTTVRLGAACRTRR